MGLQFMPLVQGQPQRIVKMWKLYFLKLENVGGKYHIVKLTFFLQFKIIKKDFEKCIKLPFMNIRFMRNE